MVTTFGNFTVINVIIVFLQVRKQPEVQELREYQREMRNVRRASHTHLFCPFLFRAGHHLYNIWMDVFSPRLFLCRKLWIFFLKLKTSGRNILSKKQKKRHKKPSNDKHHSHAAHSKQFLPKGTYQLFFSIFLKNQSILLFYKSTSIERKNNGPVLFKNALFMYTLVQFGWA